MRLTILLSLLLLLPATNNVFAISSIKEPAIQKQAHATAIKKQSFKEKLLLKWYKKQLRKKENLDHAKKAVNTLGYFSLGAGLLAPILLLLTAGIASYGFAVFLGIFAMALALSAIILGFISLRKRKRLEDKSGTSIVPAIIGLIAGSAFILILIIAILTFTINYSG